MAYPKIVLDQRHFVDEPSVIVYKKNDRVYALDCFSKKIVSDGTDPSTVLQAAVDGVGSGELIVVRSGSYPFNAQVDVKDRALVAAGRVIVTGRGFKVGGGGKLSGFIIREVTGNAIEVAGGGVLIANNVIEYPSQDGIHIDGDAGAENLYTGNVIQSAERYGVNFERVGTADIGGHYFRENLIGNVSTTILTDAGARFKGPAGSYSYIWWIGNVIDGIKDGPAILIDGVTPVTLAGWNWLTTGKDGIAVIDVKDCGRIIVKDAIIGGPSGCTGIIWRGTNDTAFIDGIFARAISRLFALDTGAALYNKALGFMQFIDVPNPSDIGGCPHIDGAHVFATAGATVAGYLEVRIGTSNYRIPLYPLG
jgi:hypothetical protein